MWLGYFAICFVAGILSADWEHSSLVASRGRDADLAAPLFGAACLLWGANSVRALLGRSARCLRSGFALYLVLLAVGGCLAGALVFAAGETRLSERLDAAERDRQRVEASSDASIRIVDATIESRTARRWGDEFVLSQVRAVDAFAAVPRRLLLRDSSTRSLSASDAKPRIGQTHAASAPRSVDEMSGGQRVRLGLRISPLHSPRNPGVVDRDKSWARRGVAAKARFVDPNWLVVLEGPASSRSGWSAWSQNIEAERLRLREAVGKRLERAGDETGLVRALALGDRRALEPRVEEDFRALGLSHLLAVSGLHIGMVAAICGWLALRATAWLFLRVIDPFPWVMASALVGAGCYAHWVGASVSAQRAFGCLFIFGLLSWVRRAPPPIDVLAGVALAMLWGEPALLFELGPQLSFAACLGLVLSGVWRGSLGELPRASSRIPLGASRLERLRRGLGVSARISCAAGFGTAIVLVPQGLGTAPSGPIINAVAIPWTGWFVLPASLCSAVLASFSHTLGIDPSNPYGFQRLAFGLFHGTAEGLVAFSSWAAARMPAFSGRSFGEASLGVLILAAATGLWAIRAGRPGTSVACWLLVVCSAGVPRAETEAMRRFPRVWFFDVGQGDAALVEGRGGSILIDAGPGAPDGSGGRALLQSLRALGRDRLDVMAITHADLDHRGGALRILEKLRVDELWLPSSARGDPGFAGLERAASERGTRISWRDVSDGVARVADLEIETLWPREDLVPRSRNAGSLVLRVRVGGEVLLFLGDVGRDVEARLSQERPNAIRADYLKVSHHASRGGSSRAFLSSVGARHAIVSAPCRNARGLPNHETLDRIDQSAARLWWTGRDGAIVAFPGRVDRGREPMTWGRRRRCRD